MLLNFVSRLGSLLLLYSFHRECNPMPPLMRRPVSISIGMSQRSPVLLHVSFSVPIFINFVCVCVLTFWRGRMKAELKLMKL